MKNSLLEICYLIGSVTFIVGLKMMGNAKTARRGNTIGAVGMTIAILGTIFLFQKRDHGVTDINYQVPGIIYALIFGAIAIGSVIGWLTAKRVQMTKMPELVSMFNGMGGACAALISLIELDHIYKVNAETTAAGEIINPQYGGMISIILGVIICFSSFFGRVFSHFK